MRNEMERNGKLEWRYKDERTLTEGDRLGGGREGLKAMVLIFEKWLEVDRPIFLRSLRCESCRLPLQYVSHLLFALIVPNHITTVGRLGIFHGLPHISTFEVLLLSIRVWVITFSNHFMWDLTVEKEEGEIWLGVLRTLRAYFNFAWKNLFIWALFISMKFFNQEWTFAKCDTRI